MRAAPRRGSRPVQSPGIDNRRPPLRLRILIGSLGLVLGLAVADGEVNLEDAESSAEPAGDLGRRIELEIEQDRGSLGAKVLELTDAGL